MVRSSTTLVPLLLLMAPAPAITASPAGTNASPVLVTEFIFETAPFPSCHASTLAETRSGLVAAWFGGTAEGNPDVGIWVSRLENHRWTPPVEAANGAGSGTNRFPCWNPVLFQPKTGPLMLFYKVGPYTVGWQGMLMTSDDDGRNWSAPRRLPGGMIGPVKNKPLQLANGDILCPSSSDASGRSVHFERTRDLGKTWQATPPVSADPGVAPIQPTLLRHSATRLQALGRTSRGRIFEVWSEDAGETWGKLTLTELPNPDSGIDAVTLKDGRQLLVYNHNIRTGSNNKGRSPLNVAVSKDGREWLAALELENDPEAPKGYAYPAVIQTGDGLVHIAYTWQRQRIKHVVLDPEKLKLRPMPQGAWPK
jgi:predicted neuraminidase